MKKLLIAFLFPLMAFGQGTPTLRFNTVADMVARPIPTVSGSLTALVTGRTAANDGGGGAFFFVPGSVTATNTGTVFPSTGVAGRWFRDTSIPYNLHWFDTALGDYAYLTTAQRLGIGLTNATAPLDINSSGAAASYGMKLLVNGSQHGAIFQNNSTTAGIALAASGAALTEPAFKAESSGYYSAFILNTADLGSELLNANAIALDANGLHSNAAYIEQGGPSATLLRNNPYSALYVTRTIGNFNGKVMTNALFLVDETTTSAAPLMRAMNQGTNQFVLSDAGALTVGASVTAPLTIASTSVSSPLIITASGALTLTPVTKITATKITEINAILQVIGASGTVNPTGNGIELRGGVTPSLLAYDRNGSAYIPMVYDAISQDFQVSGGSTLSLTSGTASVSGNVVLAVAGNGLKIKEGSNARMGVSVLNGGSPGTIVVNNTSVTASTRIFLTVNTTGGTVGFPYVSARTAATSFAITSSANGDTSAVAWLLVEPSP